MKPNYSPGPPPGLKNHKRADSLGNNSNDPVYSNGSQFLEETKIRMDALKLFFQLRDRKYTYIVDDLFRLYQFQDIAKGVFYKYRILPEGWERDLIKLKQSGDPSLRWFTPGNTKFLGETTDHYPTVNRELRFPERKYPVDNVVDELIQNERAYYEKLKTFVNCYVAEVEAISDQKVGLAATEALGLSKVQVEFAFGRDLMKVTRASERFLITLETLSLVDAQPNIPGGRPGQLAKIMVLSGVSMVQAYGPYNAKYQMAKKVIEENSVLAMRNRQKYVEGMLPHLNFIELWHEISQTKGELKNSKMDSILMQPIRRFPNYKVFFEKMVKMMPDSDPGKATVEEACQKVVEFTHMINQEVADRAAALSLLNNQLFPQAN